MGTNKLDRAEAHIAQVTTRACPTSESSQAVDAAPSFDEKEIWYCSKEIMLQLRSALRKAKPSCTEGSAVHMLEKFQSTIADETVAPGNEIRRYLLPGMTAQNPLPSRVVGKILPSTPSTEDVKATKSPVGSVSSAADQSQSGQPTPVSKKARLDVDETFKGKKVAQDTDVVASTAANPLHAVGQADSLDSVPRLQRPTGDNSEVPAINYRGVTLHKRSGRYESHIWVKSMKKQAYLGGFQSGELAAEAYDIVAIKMKGTHASLNFPIERYEATIPLIESLSVEEVIMAVRRQSSCFSRGTSTRRGVTRHTTKGREDDKWEARMGISGHKHVYLGLHNTEAEAAKAYDRALVRSKGPLASTNYAIREYDAAMSDYSILQTHIQRGDQPFIDMVNAQDQKNMKLYQEYLRGGIAALPRLC
jgi:hypothetical protein